MELPQLDESIYYENEINNSKISLGTEETVYQAKLSRRGILGLSRGTISRRTRLMVRRVSPPLLLISSLPGTCPVNFLSYPFLHILYLPGTL